MNGIIKAIEERRSIRKFQPTMPAKDDLAQIVEAGLYAASGMGRQSAIIVAVTNKELRDELAKTNAEIMGKPDFDPFYGAPAIFVVLADKSCRTAIYDGSLVMGNLMLAAHSLGLGSIWIHRAKEEFERVKMLVGMSAYYSVTPVLKMARSWKPLRSEQTSRPDAVASTSSISACESSGSVLPSVSN